MAETLNFEDLGVQLGIIGDEDGKKNYLAFLDTEKEALQKQHKEICLEVRQAMEQYYHRLENLINNKIDQNIDKVIDKRNKILKDLIAENGLLISLKQGKDDEQKKELIDSAIKELNKLTSKASETLSEFKNTLETELSREQIFGKLTEQLTQFGKAAQELTNNYQQKSQLERGYSYGLAVRKMIDP